MSKDIIKARGADKKDAQAAQETRCKFDAKADVTAKDCRQITELETGTTLDQKVDEAWTRLNKLIKDAAGQGLSMVTVNGVVSVHPGVRAAIVKRLERAGFQHELAAGQGHVYW